jgi:hypothetical protein
MAVTAPAFAVPTPQWKSYRWSRTGPLAINLGSNVSSAWTSYVKEAAVDWTRAKNIDFVQSPGRTTASSCSAVYGSVQACSGNYGANGWLGYANVWTSGGFVVMATVKLNDYYFKQARYNTTAFREMVVCQEIGHTLGLGHSNEIKTNANVGSCMDYTNDPSGKLGTNGTLANIDPSSDDFASLNNIYRYVDKTQLSYTKPDQVVGHAYSILDGGMDESITALPEPSTWALLITGFGFVGTSMRRRSRQGRTVLA